MKQLYKDTSKTVNINFIVFTLLWSISTLIHQFVWPNWFWKDIPIGWPVTIFCFLHIINGGKKKIYFILAVISTVIWYFWRLPFMVNHLHFELIISFLIGALIVYYYTCNFFFKKELQFDKLFFKQAVPLIRTSLILLYFFSVLPKLNTDFFNPEVSCGAVLFEGLFNNLKLYKIGFLNSFFNNNTIIISYVSIYFALIIEIIIPLLLILKRTRKISLLIGMLFHFILGLEGVAAIFSFTAMIFTYYSLFWDKATYSYYWKTLSTKATLLKIIFSIVIVIISLGFFFTNQHNFKYLIALPWIFYSLIMIFIYTNSLRKNKVDENEILLFNSSLKLLYIFPLAVFISGISPYLGLKTQTSFSMFSNLKTEDNYTNHLFIPITTQLFNYQKELVTIEETNISFFTEKDIWTPDQDYQYVLFDFITKLNNINNGFIKFKVADNEYYVEKRNGKVIESNIDLYQSILAKKFLNFRPVYTAKTSYCRQ